MTDPERISKRGGFAAQLLQAGANEQPGDAGVERALVALGISGAVLASTSAVSAAAAGSKLTGAAALSGGAAASVATGTVSAVVLVKWIGIGVVGGLSLAGAARVATSPTAPATSVTSVATHRAVSARVAPTPVRVEPEHAPIEPALSPQPILPALPSPHPSVVEPRAATAELDVGMPLAAEVAFVDRGRALVGSGQTLEGLALLEHYEQEFSEARLLPEVLFLRLEANERLGRTSEARRSAERLVKGFPKSPHAARARKLLQK
jgi:hypothetical protein